MINWQLVQNVTLPPVCKSCDRRQPFCDPEWRMNRNVDVWVGVKQKKTTQYDFYCGEIFFFFSSLGLRRHKIVALHGLRKHEKLDWSTLVVIYVVGCSQDTNVKQIPKNLEEMTNMTFLIIIL